MALCPVSKIDSNDTSLFYTEEQCLKQLPGSPVWHGLSPNSYSDFGGELTTTAREPIEQGRQNKKGSVVDLEASGGFNHDLVQFGLTRLLQGFFYANARQPLSTDPLNGTKIPITSVTGSSETYSVASGMPAFTADMLVWASGFGISSNNGLKTVASATSTTLVVDENLVDEASPPAAARLDLVGFQLAADDVAVSVVGDTAALTSTTTNFTTLGRIVGEQIVITGFANNSGYARILSISANTLVLDDCEFEPVTEAATGVTVRLWIGTTIRNEKNPALIKQKSYQFERRLGFKNGYEQAEYLEGAVANELTINMPQAEKVTVDMSFLACSESQRDGDPTDPLKTGTRVPTMAEDAFNTTNNVRRIKMALVDASAYPNPLFIYLTDASLTISNNATANKAIGVLGAMAITAGNFTVSGSATAYFDGLDAKRAIRENADVGINVTLAADNSAQVFDIPLLTLGGGRINVEKDAPVTIPLDIMGAENKFGFTASYTEFRYLPDSMMASAIVT